MSTFDKNFKAKANSIKPKVTFTEFNHPPDLGIEFNHDGNMANKVNGKANEMENPNIPINGPMYCPLFAASTNKVPMSGPVHENDAMANTTAMKKIPIKPPLSAFASAFVDHELGNVISNAPKKEVAKITSTRKNTKLKMASLDNSFKALAPNKMVMPKPNPT